MFRLAVVCAVMAVACAAPAPGLIASPLATPLLAPSLPATLLPRVAVAPAETTIVRQPIVVEEPTPILRSVPVPVRAVSYAAPSVISPLISSPLASPYISSPLASPYISSPLATPYISSSLGSPIYSSPLATSSLLLK